MHATGLFIASRHLVLGAIFVGALAQDACATDLVQAKKPLSVDGSSPFNAFVVSAEAPGDFVLRTEGGTQGAVRLFGVDVPVFKPACLSPDGNKGQCRSNASETLARIVRRTDNRVTCIFVDAEAPLPTAQCLLGDEDLAAVLIQNGYAYADQKLLFDQRQRNAAWASLHTQYVAAEENAKANRRGLWATTTPPQPFYNQRKPVSQP